MLNLKRIDRRSAIVSYLLIAIASNGYFAIYLPTDNPGSPLFVWLILFFVGFLLIILKTLRFPAEERLKIVGFDVIYFGVLLLGGMIPLPGGLNIILASVLAVLLLFRKIDPDYLIRLA